MINYKKQGKTIPRPERVSEIQKTIRENWPSRLIMPPCPRDEDCDNCPKNVEGSGENLPPCIRDIAHYAAIYEAFQQIAQNVVDKRSMAAERLKTSKRRMLGVLEQKKGVLKQRIRPKALRTYGKNRFDTMNLNILKDRFTDGKSKVGNRELAKFIFNIDRLFQKEKNLGADNREELIILAQDAVKPKEGPHKNGISEEVIRKTRIRYRHLNKK